MDLSDKIYGGMMVRHVFITLLILFILLFQSNVFSSDVCPSTGKITVLCHKNPLANAISLTGCYNGGLTLCTSQISSCAGVNEKSIQKANWKMPKFNAQKFKFLCPGEDRETQAQHIALDAAVWKRVADKAVRNKPKICPRDKLPILCNQQTKGILLIGCHNTGLSYIYSDTIRSCDQLNDKTLKGSHWIQARYNDKNQNFEIPGVQATSIHKHIIINTADWDRSAECAIS